MTDVNQAVSQEPAAPDLDSILSSAIETHTPKEEPAAAESAAPEVTEPKAEHPTDPTRYADGTFKPTKPDSAAPAASPVEPTAGAAPAAPTPTPEPVIQPLEAPARWTADQKAKFAAWSRDVQESVLERNNAIEADYTRKTQEAADLRRSAEPILNAVKPFEQYLSQVAPRIGLTPDRMIGNLIGVEYQLRTGDPYTKVQALQQIAAEYGIDLAAISRGEMPAQPDPAYTQLRQSFGTLEQRLAATESLLEQQRQEGIAQQIETFAAATDAAGQPLRPYFNTVRAAMGQLLGSDSSLTLEAAYAEAVKPIEDKIAQELKTRQDTAEKRRLESLDKARKMTPIKTISGATPNGSAKSTDLDSMLWDNINAKLS